MTFAYVGLGSNLGHPRRQLASAVRALRRLPRSRLVAVSPSYVTAPLGSAAHQPDYVNAVAVLATSLAPGALLKRLLAIERRHRRTRTQRNAPRTLDLDLLLFGRRCMRSDDLSIPHPRMHVRAFVLRPLADVAPAVQIPGRGAVQLLLRDVANQRVARTRNHRLDR